MDGARRLNFYVLWRVSKGLLFELLLREIMALFEVLFRDIKALVLEEFVRGSTSCDAKLF